MNFSAITNAPRLLLKPQLLIPQRTVATFDKLPIPLSCPGWPDIRAVVLDKDNCFAVKHTAQVYGPYRDHFDQLRRAYPGDHLLIVSNRAGTDDHVDEGVKLERETDVKVLRHTTRKPGCGSDILNHFRASQEVKIEHPSQIAVVGDRLFTDIMLANMMGSLGVWVKEGVEPETGLLAQLEKAIPRAFERLGLEAPKAS